MLPTWLAPNLITLIGITGLIIAFLVTATMLPELAGEAFSCIKAAIVLVYAKSDQLEHLQQTAHAHPELRMPGMHLEKSAQLCSAGEALIFAV